MCNINELEANELLKHLKKILFDPNSNKFNYYLLITFTDEQAEYLRKLIFDNPIENDEFIRLGKKNRLAINYIPSLQGSELMFI